jgi:23S rRNA pseudouridine1911/1915/1917 synthase
MVDAPIGRSRRDPTRMAVSTSGREARTRYDVERRFTEPVEVTLLGCRLETGRTHQIRIHFSESGHPLVGEEVYVRDYTGPVIASPRMLLHAATLGFDHPITGERVELSSALPPDFTAMLDKLR